MVRILASAAVLATLLLAGCGSGEASSGGTDSIDTKGLTNGPVEGRDSGAGKKAEGATKAPDGAETAK